MMYYPVLVLLYVKFVLVHSASFKQGFVPPRICETKECHAAADHIIKWMNPAYKPCEDFYEFSCGYWHSPDNQTENKQHNMSLGSRGDMFPVHLKNLLLDDTIDKESKLFKMAKNFLTMCLDEESIEARSVSPAIEFMRKAGGWLVLEENWSEDGWDFLQTEALFGGAFFQFNIQPQLFDYIYRIIIYPKPTMDPFFENLAEGFQNESVQEYYKMKCDLAVQFGADRNRAEKELKDMLLFEIAMSEVAKAMNDTEGNFEGNITELQNTVTWVNWTQLLTPILPESIKWTKNQTLIVVNPEYMEKLGSLIKKYPQRTIANYVFSVGATPMKKYLMLKMLNSTSEETEPRFDTCVNMMKESSLAGIVAAYIARQTLEDTRAATDMTQNILNELLIDLNELEWLDEETRSAATKTLQETTLHIGFPDELLNLDTIETLYKEVKINSSYFFEAAMDSETWMRKDKFRNFGKSIKERSIQDQIEMATTINAYFMLGSNNIVVTAAFIHFLPLFNSKVPAYVNYGNLGGIIAHELTHALDFQADNTENRMKAMELQQPLYRWGSNATEEIYEEKKQCIIDQYSSFNESKFTGKTLDGDQTQEEDVADNGGLKLAFRAYKRMAAQLPTPEPKLPKLEQYSTDQLFMISVASAYCEIPTKEKMSMQLLRDTHSPFQFRVIGMMMNSPDFSRLFSCNKNDPMNPEKKCEVW